MALREDPQNGSVVEDIETGPDGFLRVSAGTPEEMAAFRTALSEILHHQKMISPDEETTK